MLVLQDIDENIGGLEVVPDAANDETQAFFSRKVGKKFGDFVSFPKSLLNDEHFKVKNGLVKCKAGDLILWDSRTPHGAIMGPGYTKENCPLSNDKFARLAFTVCMTPASKASK